MPVDRSSPGFAMRSWGYSMLVNDGNDEQMLVEPDDEDHCPLDSIEV